MSGISPASSVLSLREKRVALAGPANGPLRGAAATLRGAGYHVAAAEDLSGLQGLEAGIAPDLVVLDIDLPPSGALTAVRALRQKPFWRFVSMMLAVPAGRPHLEEVHIPGVNDVILAPFPADELLDKVRRLTVIPARRELNTLVKVLAARPDGSPVIGKTLNLSQNGVLIEVEAPMTIGRVIDLEFFLPDEAEPLRARGRVIRRTSELDLFHPAFGVRFVEMGEKDQARVTAFVDERERVGARRPASGQVAG